MSLLPLDGIRVIEIGQLLAIPSAGQQLLEFGADVIKVEPPGGEASRTIDAPYAQAIFRAVNRGKKAVEVDFKSPEGLQQIEALIAGADVVLHNYRPGTLAKLGLSYERMTELKSDIISVSVSGFGSRGPSATRAGLDIAAQAESGLMSVTGEPDNDPQRTGAPIIDQSTSYVVTQVVMAALIRRDRFGCGTEARVPLLNVAVHLQSCNWVQQQISGEKMTRTGSGQPGVAPAADVITAADGQFVVSGYQPSAWRALCEVLGIPELLDDERFVDNAARVRNRHELLTILSQKLASFRVQDAVDLLAGAGVVAAVVRDYTDVMAAEDVVANDLFATASSHLGDTFQVPRHPVESARGLTRTALEGCELGIPGDALAPAVESTS